MSLNSFGLKFKSFNAFIVVAVYVTATLASTIVKSPVVYAEELVTPRDRAIAWQATNNIIHCLDFLSSLKKGTEKNINNGGIFTATGTIYSSGYLLSPSDGRSSCIDTNMKKAFDIIDIKPITFFTKNVNGYVKDPDNSKGFIQDTSYSHKKAVSALKKYTKENLGIDPTKPLNKASQYITLKSAFDLACKITEYSSLDEIPDNLDQDRYSIYVEVNGKTGEVKNKFFSLKKGDIPIGNGITVIDGLSSPTQATCHQIANGLANTAAEYSDAIKKLNADGVSTDIKDSKIPSVVDEDNKDDDDNTCESKGGVLGWIACPILNVLSDGLQWIEKQAISLLSMDREFYSGEGKSNDKGVKGAWTLFRNIGYILLVPIMLVMVIGTALGFEIFSAYTVKTALPRMVFAIIFMALSFHVLVFVVDFTQTVGSGAQNLILKPFGITSDEGMEDAIVRSSSSAAGAATGTVTGAGIIGGSLISTFVGVSIPAAIWTIIGFLGTAVMMMMFVFVLLLFRETMIVLLIIVAPLAILAWIFPGRDALFNTWFKTFWLMVWFYPVIMVVVAVGKAMATVVSG